MKAKNILALRERIEKQTDSKKFNDEDNNDLKLRFDAWDELVYISEESDKGDLEIRINLSEAKKLKSLLDKLL